MGTRSASCWLVQRGDPQHGILELWLHANGSGRVAVAFRESWEGGDVYAMTSSDSGATWTSPVRLDAGDTGNASFLGQVLVGSDGVVHAVFEQNRGSGTRVWYTRSTDGGLTFEAERDFSSIIAYVPQSYSANPFLAEASDGSILVTFWDERTTNTDRIYVLRSTDSGVGFSLN